MRHLTYLDSLLLCEVLRCVGGERAAHCLTFGLPAILSAQPASRQTMAMYACRGAFLWAEGFGFLLPYTNGTLAGVLYPEYACRWLTSYMWLRGYGTQSTCVRSVITGCTCRSRS
jgi:hypothetical protein